MLHLVVVMKCSTALCVVLQESPDAEQLDKNDPNYDSGEEKRALAFHSRKVEQIKAYKQAVNNINNNNSNENDYNKQFNIANIVVRLRKWCMLYTAFCPTSFKAATLVICAVLSVSICTS